MNHSGPAADAAAPAAPPPRSHATGNRLGKYVITGRLGKGGMGAVYAAFDPVLDREVAIKVLPRPVAADAEARKRFQIEAQAAARLSHPNVVAVYDIDHHDGSFYLVMELVRGGSAQDFLTRRGAFHWAEATSIAADACRGLAAAHAAGLIHRDIKPGNILRSDTGVVKLGDFGLAKLTDNAGTRVTELGSIIGTPQYMSPEQGRAGLVDERSDVYALGATYYALLTGRPPFTGMGPVEILFAHATRPVPDPRTLVPAVPETAAAIVRKAMAKHRDERYPDAAALLADLEAALARRPVAGVAPAAPPAPLPPFVWSGVSWSNLPPGVPPTVMTRPPRSAWPWLGAAGVVALAGLALVTAAVAWLLMRSPAGHQAPPALPPPAVKGASAAPPPASDRWPALAAAAEHARVRWRPDEMRRALHAVRDFQRRHPDHREARTAADRLAHALAFRSRITADGLALTAAGRVDAVAVAPSGQWLAAAGNPGGVRFWDLHAGQQRYPPGLSAESAAHKTPSLAFAPDGRTLAVGCADEPCVRLWDLSGGPARRLGAGDERVLAVAFAPDGKALAAGLSLQNDGAAAAYVKLWDMPAATEPFVPRSEHTSRVWAVAFSPDGRLLATGSNDKRVVLWERSTGRIVQELHIRWSVTGVCFAPHGRTLAVAGYAKAGRGFQVWDVDRGELLHSKTLNDGFCRQVAFSPDGRLLASAAGPLIHLWRTDTWQQLATLPGHPGEVLSLTFAPHGHVLVSGGNDGLVRLWDVGAWAEGPP